MKVRYEQLDLNIITFQLYPTTYVLKMPSFGLLKKVDYSEHIWPDVGPL